MWKYHPFIGNRGKFEGTFCIDPLRTAALIIGIVFAVFAAGGALLKLGDIPGGGTLLVLSTGCFCLFALPLQLIYNVRRNKIAVRRVADVTGLFGTWFLLLGLLYKAQAWPGAHTVLLSGIFFTAFFGVLFFAASRAENAVVNWFPGFTVTVLVMLVSLGAAWMEKSVDTASLDEQAAQFRMKKDECAALLARTNELVAALDADTGAATADAYALHMRAIKALQQVEDAKTGLIEAANHRYGATDDNTIHNAGDIDITTMYMVGIDVVHPTGKGIEVYWLLKSYREEILPADVAFTIPVSGDAEAQEQWVKDNFYHATVLEALTRLTNVEIAMLNALNTALEIKAHKD